MDCLINVEGGLGKNIMLTSILHELKEEGGFEHLYVMSPYYDVFKCCPDVDESFPTGQPSLYQELVLDPNVEVFWKDPYNNSDFIKKKCHLFNAWRAEFGLDTDARTDENGSNVVPNISVDLIKEVFYYAYDAAVKKAEELGDFIIVQFCGGQSPMGDLSTAYNDHEEGIKRNYYKGQEVVDGLREQYPGHKIVHYALPNEPTYEGTIKLELPYMSYVVLAEYAAKVVCTDSSLQHIATGHCPDVTVIWGETRPEHFGYKCNKNIAAQRVYNSQAYFRPLGSSPAIVHMPTPEEVLTMAISDSTVKTAE